MTDRPWAITLWELGARRYTGQLTLRAESRRYAIAFDHGAVVAAASPLASDSAVRIALTHHLISPAQAAELTRRGAAAPGRDELDVLAEVARLPPDRALRLRRKIIEQRAARTFSLDEGELTVGPEIEIPVVTGLEVDVRGVIYLGARMHLAEQRLGDELRQLGSRFTLAPGARGELGPFGFTEAEQPILDALEAGTSLAELEARHRDLDPRTVRAVIYALACCSLCTAVPGAPRAGAGAGEAAAGRPRAHSGREVFGARAAAAAGARSSGSRTPIVTMSEYRMISAAPPPAAAGGSRPQAPRAPASGPDEAGVVRPSRAQTRPAVPRALKLPRARTSPPGAPALGRAPTPRAAPAVGRAAPAVGRTPTPAGVSALGRAQTVPATDRTPTPAGLRRRRKPTVEPAPEDAAPAPSPPPSDPPDPPDPLAAAADAFKRALSRLRVESLEEAIVDLTRAVALAPNELDYAATLAWARFCHATDKPALAQTTRELLARAIRKSPTPEHARFYLGRVERMLGRDKEALRHFQQVLAVQPRHAEAAAEVRAIEARMTQAAAKESGVFGRKR